MIANVYWSNVGIVRFLLAGGFFLLRSVNGSSKYAKDSDKILPMPGWVRTDSN